MDLRDVLEHSWLQPGGDWNENLKEIDDDITFDINEASILRTLISRMNYNIYKNLYLLL